MPETEFRKLIIRLLKSNQKKIHTLNENCSQEIEILKRSQNETLEINNSIDQITNAVEILNNRKKDIRTRRQISGNIAVRPKIKEE